MSSETKEPEEQEHREVPEDSDEKEKRLALLESEQFIRKYLNKYVATGGVILFLISFGVGFFVDRVAFQTANNQALLSAQNQIISLIREVMAAKFEVDNAVKSAQASSTEIAKTEEKSTKFAQEFSSLQSKFESTMAFQASDAQIREIADVLARDPRIAKVLDDLDQSIQSRLAKADQEIGKIKSAYKIDSQVGKIISLWEYNSEFVFSFPVKHAWIELSENLDEPYHIIPVIKGNTVVVAAKPTKPLYFPRSNKELKRMERPFVYRVWATSF